MRTDPPAFLFFFFLRMQTQNYVSETSRSDQEKLCRERIATGVSIKQLVSNNRVAGSRSRLHVKQGTCRRHAGQCRQLPRRGLAP